MILDFHGIPQELVMVSLKIVLEIFGYILELIGIMLEKLEDLLDLRVLKV